VLAHIASAGGGWVDEDDLWRDVFPTWGARSDVRNRLKAMVADGLLEFRPLGPPRAVDLLCLTPPGVVELTRAYAQRGRVAPPTTRPPRLDQAQHHLLVVAATLLVLRQAEGRLLRLFGDEDLRSQARTGSRAHEGRLADGRLAFSTPGRSRAEVDIEILTSKYDDETIREKHAGLRPETLFFAPGRRLCDRVEGLVGRRPYLL
jgi:hypothetical protein